MQKVTLAAEVCNCVRELYSKKIGNCADYVLNFSVLVQFVHSDNKKKK